MSIYDRLRAEVFKSLFRIIKYVKLHSASIGLFTDLLRFKPFNHLTNYSFSSLPVKKRNNAKVRDTPEEMKIDNTGEKEMALAMNPINHPICC
ncbi:MAG: hypothetical protein RXQ98_01900, partial [Sulfolobaceae archaeon]